MNILTDALPDTVTVNGTEYRVDPDFRSCLLIMLAFEDNELTPQEKQAVLLQNLYVDMPEDRDAASLAAVEFLNGGKEGGAGGPRLYSFSKDAGYIFSAFRQTHGIDLDTEDLHWWKFVALFLDMGADTTFCNLVSLRKRIKTGKGSKEERQAAREMGEVFDVPEYDTRTLDEKEREAEFMRLVRS